MIIDPERAIGAAGAWEHRDVSANGARFHVVEAGQGPAVLLLHGFPLFWWTWRQQLTALAEAGYRAIAMDLRGYGGSDHTPHGYDPVTLAADIAGVVRSLGEEQACIVGHGWGGLGAWSVAVLQPSVVRGIVPVSMPHPRAMRANLRRTGQWRRLGFIAGFQVPIWPERSLTRQDGARVEQFLRAWSGDDGWVDTAAGPYRSAFLRWPTAHTAIEGHRWAVRSRWRTDGRRYMAAMTRPVAADVLHVHGALDPIVLADSCAGSAAFVQGTYQLWTMPAGHFPQEEDPHEFTAGLLAWLSERPGVPRGTGDATVP